jgi:hypothetical protein
MDGMGSHHIAGGLCEITMGYDTLSVTWSVPRNVSRRVCNISRLNEFSCH